MRLLLVAKSAVSAAPVEFMAVVADICRDVAVFVYPFPLLNLAVPILRAAGVPWVAAFRGGDAYRWLVEPEAEANQGLVWSAYREALQGSASVTAASTWLVDVGLCSRCHPGTAMA